MSASVVGMHTDLPPNRLRELLKARGQRAVHIAALMNVSETTVWRWEEGLIPQQRLPAIAEYLGVSVPYLAGWSDEANGDPAELVA